jgi:Transposase IS200 like
MNGMLDTARCLDKSSGMQYICSIANEIKAHRNSAYSSQNHVVICPKYRRNVLVPPKDGRLKTFFLQPLRSGKEFIEMKVMPDHVQRHSRL